MAIDVSAPPRPAAGGPGEPPAGPTKWPRRPGRRPQTTRLLVRLHFLSGFLAAPIILSLAVTGILFAWNPQIETALHGSTLSSTDPGVEPKPLTEQVAAAQAEHPGWKVTAITPAAPEAFEGRETTAIAMSPPAAADGGAFGHAAGAVSVYVDPATAQVTGEIDEAKRPGEWLRNLHSSWRLGDNVAPLSELAASWLLVSILTGLYLKWPALRRNLGRTLSFRGGRTPYARANALHTTLGIWLTAGLLALVGTGLTWTNFAGSRVDDLKATFSSPAPAVSTTLPGAAPAPAVPAGEHAEHGGADAAPAAPAFDVAAVLPQIDTVAAGANAAGVSGLMKYTPPGAEGKAWKAELRDTKWPVEPVTLAVDGTSGEVVDRVEWDDRPLMAKGTSLGVYFHQATLFGIWTQIFLTVLAIAVIVLIVAGYRMWWIRRPRGTLGIPPKVGPLWRSVPVAMMVGFGLLAYALPMLAVSFLIYLVLERLWRAVYRPRPLPEPPATNRNEVSVDA